MKRTGRLFSRLSHDQGPVENHAQILTAYRSGHLQFIGQAYCNTLSAYWSSFHPAYPELLRLTKQFFNMLVLCLLEKPRHMITLTNPGLVLPAWLPKEGGSITKHEVIN